MPRALVTGSSGFVGRHISVALERRGWEVTGIDPVRPSREGSTHTFFKNTVSEYIDYTMEHFDTNYHRFDLVVHCAYEVGGRAHIDGKNLALAHNLQTDALLFDWAVKTGQKAVLYFSSCAAYPAFNQSRLFKEFWGEESRAKEDDINFGGSNQGPFDNYGWAKLTGERLGRAASELGLRVHTVRPFSGYGADQSLDYPFPSIVRRAREGDLSVWGPEGQYRDWIHISDVVNGAIAVYEADLRDPVNLCTGVETEFGDFAQLVFKLSHPDETFIPPTYYESEKPTGPLYRVGDPTRMNSVYTAKISLEEGIRETLGRI